MTYFVVASPPAELIPEQHRPSLADTVRLEAGACLQVEDRIEPPMDAD